MILQKVTQSVRFRWKFVKTKPMKKEYKNFNFISQKSLYLRFIENSTKKSEYSMSQV